MTNMLLALFTSRVLPNNSTNSYCHVQLVQTSLFIYSCTTVSWRSWKTKKTFLSYSHAAHTILTWTTRPLIPPNSYARKTITGSKPADKPLSVDVSSPGITVDAQTMAYWPSRLACLSKNHRPAFLAWKRLRKEKRPFFLWESAPVNFAEKGRGGARMMTLVTVGPSPLLLRYRKNFFTLYPVIKSTANRSRKNTAAYSGVGWSNVKESKYSSAIVCSHRTWPTTSLCVSTARTTISARSHRPTYWSCTSCWKKTRQISTASISVCIIMTNPHLFYGVVSEEPRFFSRN